MAPSLPEEEEAPSESDDEVEAAANAVLASTETADFSHDPIETYIPFHHTILLEGTLQKRPEDFLGSEPSTSATLGFPLRAIKDCNVLSRSQVTVPVAFEPDAVRPAWDYIVEQPSKAVAAVGIRAAKTLINGREDQTSIPLINVCLQTMKVKAGDIVGWAFPLETEDTVVPCQNAKGKQDHIPLRPRSKRLQAITDRKAGCFAHSIAIEDLECEEDDFAPTRMSTDETLPIPQQDEVASPETQALFDKYQICEKTLTYAQK
jgi:hypothetical protein